MLSLSEMFRTLKSCDKHIILKLPIFLVLKQEHITLKVIVQ